MKYKIWVLVEENPRRIARVEAYEEADVKRKKKVDLSKDMEIGIDSNESLRIFFTSETRLKMPTTPSGQPGLYFSKIYSPIPQFTIIEFEVESKEDPLPPPSKPIEPIGDLM